MPSRYVPILLQACAFGGHPIRTDNCDIDEAVLHQMSASIVRDHCMGHAMPAQFPCGERRALIARPRFIDIDVDGNAGIMCGTCGCCRADIDGRQPGQRCNG